jgi:GNAT superfamily N-acetyltransferase
MKRTPCEVREADPKHADLLEQEMPTGGSRFHEVRLEGQRTGYATYLIAWVAGRPVGHLFLKWHGADEAIVHEHLGDVPEFNGIGVQPELRSQGIGSKLIRAAERLASSRGYSRVGLGVGVENERAWALPSPRLHGLRLGAIPNELGREGQRWPRTRGVRGGHLHDEGSPTRRCRGHFEVTKVTGGR